jgi:hypothetical protein
MPVNENEAILEAFWNGDKNGDGSRLDVMAPYRVTWLKGADGSLRPPAYFTISKSASGGPSLVLERECNLNISGYDRFILCASLPKSIRLRLQARLDGSWKNVIADADGMDTYEEYQGVFKGSHLSGLRFEFTQTGTIPAVITLNWLMVANTAGVERMLSRKPVLDPKWPGLLEAEPDTAQPQLGLFFDKKQLTALRAKLRSPHLKPHYEILLNRAEELLKIKPEELVGTYAPGGDIARGCRKRDIVKTWLGAGVSDLLAFAGIVEDNPEFSRQAARMALALAHCGHWVHSFMGALPGTTGHPRCFSESYILRPLPMVLDWAGHCLTPAGRELIRDAMIMKGLARVESDFRRWEYIRGMNQGLLFTPGRIHSYLALEKVYPRYDVNLREAERDMKAMLNRYLQPDGGTLEGMGYWHSVGEVFPTLYALSRRHGKPFRDAMGERIRRTADYAMAMLSSAGAGNEFLHINAIHAHGDKPSLMMAAVFAHTAENNAWKRLYSQILKESKPQADWFHLLMAPEKLEGTKPAISETHSVFYHFPATGHAGVRRHAEGIGTVRFHLFSGPSRGGHSHQDKGSFILEAGGEQLAMDRGTTTYDNSAHLLMNRAAWHNLTVPEDSDGKALEQQPQSTSGGRLLFAKFADDALDIQCDNRNAWAPDIFRRNRRRIWAPAPEIFIIDDDLKLRNPHLVSFRLNSVFPMVKDETGVWCVNGTKARLRILPINWSPIAESATIEGIDWLGNPVWLLRLAAASSARHRLLTLLELVPTAEPLVKTSCRTVWNADSKTVELQFSDSSKTFKYSLKG